MGDLMVLEPRDAGTAELAQLDGLFIEEATGFGAAFPNPPFKTFFVSCLESEESVNG
jgi:hypothetical protein